jgi:hypothetical protein
MKLIITIDTEEDNWACYSTTENSVKNIEKIVHLQALFDRYGVKPTYLITYPVATNPSSVAIIKRILEDGKCEIGTHCHPWNTPPFEEEINDRNSMLCNLPEELQFRKLEQLHEAIFKNFGISPVSFRAGRWGFSKSVARALARLGYRVDTSVTPYTDWSVYHGPNFSDFRLKPYRFDPESCLLPQPGGKLLQVPATIGYLQGNFELCHRLSQHFESAFYKKLHLKGILSRLGLLNKVWLSPEQFDAGSMKKLSGHIMNKNLPCLNMGFHSTALMYGLSPFVTCREEEADFLRRIDDFLHYSVDSGFKSMTLSHFEKHFCTLPENNLNS